jgi:hypothetical protein
MGPAGAEADGRHAAIAALVAEGAVADCPPEQPAATKAAIDHAISGDNPRDLTRPSLAVIAAGQVCPRTSHPLYGISL